MVVAPLSHTVVSCGGRVHCGLDSGRFSACPQVTAVMAAGRGGGTAQEKDPVSIMRGGVCAGLDSCRPHVAGTGQGRAPGARGPPPRPRSWRIRRSPAHSSPSWMRGHREPGPQLITVECRFRWSMALSSPCRRWRASSSGRRSRSSEAGRVRQIRRSAPSPVPSRDGDAALGGARPVRSCRAVYVLVPTVTETPSCIGPGWPIFVHHGLTPPRSSAFPQVTALEADE